MARLLQVEDGEPTIAVLRDPLLAFFGALEPGGALEAIQQLAGAARVATAVIADADHVYLEHETDVAGLIAGWSASLVSV